MSQQARQHVATTSADVNGERLAQLQALYPEAFSEGRVDLYRLRQALGQIVDDAPERYTFTWAGKRDALRLLQAPTRATLLPCREESVHWDTTEHTFIEGDNLEVLKLLYKAYFGRVKMIYIDPPYNTGNDFIYPDDYADPLAVYLRLTGQQDEAGNLLTSNPESSGRYHSAWLSMMYPRLFIARQLLQEDGVIFVSIDDNEVYNLRQLMNEVFGEEEFIGTFVWKSRHNVDSRNKSGFSKDHEYVVAYGRSIRGRSIDEDKYSNPDNDPRGVWMSDNLVGLASVEKRPNLHYDLVDPETGINYGCPEKGWRYNRETMGRLISEDKIIWPSSPAGRPRRKKFLSELQSRFTGLSSLLLEVPNTSAGTQEVRELFGSDVFDFPKPLGLVRLLVQQATYDDDIVLDFFAGSCPTAQAVLELNRAESTSRRFVMVQLPEQTPEGSPARRSGYDTISDIGQERIRRVIAQMQQGEAGQLPLDLHPGEDLGFKVFKLAPSNYQPWAGVGEEGHAAYAAQMALFHDPLVPGWQAEDVIYEVALKEGYGLNCHIEPAAAGANAVYRVSDPDREQSFAICLDDEIRLAGLAGLDLGEEDLFVCRDVALDDEAAANLALQCRLKTI